MRCRWLSDMCWSGRTKWEWPCRLQTRRAALAVAVECGWTWAWGSGSGVGRGGRTTKETHSSTSEMIIMSDVCFVCCCATPHLLLCDCLCVCVSVFTLWFMFVWCDLFKRTNAKIWFAIKDLPGRNYCVFNCCSMLLSMPFTFEEL